MYSSLYQFMVKYLYPGKEIRRSLNELEGTQWLPRSELESMQLKKLQRLVSYAYAHVPFYRKLYQSENIHPQDIKSFKDFQALPFLTRDDVNNHLQDLVSTDYRGHFIEMATSGSTGHPMQFFLDRSDCWWTSAFSARCRGWYGVNLGDKRAFVYSYLLDFSDWRWKDRLVGNIKHARYLNARTMTKTKMQAFAEMLVKWQPTMFRAYPSALSIFAHYIKEQGITNISPKLIESTAEKVTPSQRQLFEEVFQAPIADNYSSLEIDNMAYQCPEGGLHVSEERYLELVANGRVVNPGQMGEVVLTSLIQYAMPFIRYKNSDVGIYESEDCSCGRGMPVLREIVGRNCDLLTRPDGQIVHWTSIYTIMKYKPEVYQWQLYQSDQEHLEVRLVCKQKSVSTLLEDIRTELQPCFGESMHISVKLVDRIELTSSGKYRYVISEVKPDFI